MGGWPIFLETARLAGCFECSRHGVRDWCLVVVSCCGGESRVCKSLDEVVMYN